ncbi:LysR family transcriptional regulator [Aeromicrobium sp. REDSEA-S32_B7]|jgi:DNA-binding transcriptional LysR family regulator|uniref:LysR family transcriptional regulator n=2 Tax=unclassified Aeromicrobium TaxID=2633570 RepID=UPI000ABEE677|nr:LysR family transcriptional regulator [Aeromicrobium sp. REDSEA-S32_B7]
MDVRRLMVLRELSERGSVGAVADAMRVTPSAVSQQLKALEKEAGYPLVEPSGRGVALTEAGRALARAATDIAVAIERAEGEWRAFMEQPAGRVTLVTFPTGGEMLLPGLLTRMAERPDVELVCTDTEDPDAVGDLTADHDVVLSDSPTTSAAWHDRGLQVVPLMSEPLDVALPQDHPLARKANLSPRDVVDETWIGVPPGYPFDRVLEQVVVATGQPVQVAQRFADNGVVEAMVAGGHGLAILPRFTTREHGNGLVTRPLLGVRARREISAVLRPDRFERPSVRLVVQALREEARLVADAHGAA